MDSGSCISGRVSRGGFLCWDDRRRLLGAVVCRWAAWWDIKEGGGRVVRRWDGFWEISFVGDDDKECLMRWCVWGGTEW
jgi:hypothetical protein